MYNLVVMSINFYIVLLYFNAINTTADRKVGQNTEKARSGNCENHSEQDT